MMDKNEELVKIFCEITDPEIMSKFLSEILTPKERKDLRLRWELTKMIEQKVPQREIASRLHISLCKITRGAKILKDENSVTNKLLQKKL